MIESGDMSDQTQTDDQGLGFDVRTIMLGLWRKRWALLIFAAIAAALGIAGGIGFGQRYYEADTVVMYQPPKEGDEDTHVAIRMLTYVHTIKIRSNLEEVRRRLSLPVELGALGEACKVVPLENTDLLTIQITWKTAQGAADIANTLRDTWLNGQVLRHQREAGKRASDLEQRLTTVDQQLDAAEAALQKLVREHNIVDMDKEAQWYLEELIQTNILYESALADQKTAKKQQAGLDKLIDDLKARVVREQKESQARIESLTNVDIRYRRLRHAITDEKEIETGKIALAHLKAKYEAAKKLFERGVVSTEELEDARSAYETQKVRAIDSPQIEKWKGEMDELDKTIMPSQASSTPSGKLLQEMMLRVFDIELRKISTVEKAAHLKTALQRVRQRLAKLPTLQREHIVLSRKVGIREAEKKKLEKDLARELRSAAIQTPDFSVIIEAKPPINPSKSNRRIVAIGITAVLILLGFSVALAMELFDGRIRSPIEAQLKLSLPLLGALPELPDGKGLGPGKTDPDLVDIFRVAARRIRDKIPGNGRRLMIVAATHDQGTSGVALNLASCFGLQDELVLLVNGQVRGKPNAEDVAELIVDADGQIKGLGDYLSSELDSAAEVEHTTVLPGVTCLPQAEQEVLPDLLAGNRMGKLFDEASRKFSLILVDSPPVLANADAELLAHWVDAVVLVVRTNCCSVRQIRQTIDILKHSGKEIIGVIVSRVDPLYLSRN